MKAKLPVNKIFISALTLPILYHRQLIKIGWPLVLTSIFTIFIQNITSENSDLFTNKIINSISTFIFLLTLVMSIVGCHRLFIFGPKHDDEYKLFEWSGNELKYTGWWILISLTATLILIPFIFIFIPLLENLTIGGQFISYPLNLIIFVPISYLVSRCSLVLPASATDLHRKNLSWSWNLSSNNGWRLTLLIGFLPLSIDLLIGLIPGNDSIIIHLLIRLIWILTGVIQVALLSLSFSFIISNQEKND